VSAEKYVYFERTQWLCLSWNLRSLMLHSAATVKKMQEELAQLRRESARAGEP
jgi:hypothetical protein